MRVKLPFRNWRTFIILYPEFLGRGGYAIFVENRIKQYPKSDFAKYYIKDFITVSIVYCHQIFHFYRAIFKFRQRLDKTFVAEIRSLLQPNLKSPTGLHQLWHNEKYKTNPILYTISLWSNLRLFADSCNIFKSSTNCHRLYQAESKRTDWPKYGKYFSWHLH